MTCMFNVQLPRQSALRRSYNPRESRNQLKEGEVCALVGDKWTRVPCWVLGRVCAISDARERYKESILSQSVCTRDLSLHLFQLFTQKEHDQSLGGGDKYEMGHQRQAPVNVVYKSMLCSFSVDVAVTHSVIASNELHSLLHFIYGQTIFHSHL